MDSSNYHSNRNSRNNSLASILNHRDVDADADADTVSMTMPMPLRHNSDSSASSSSASSSTGSRPDRKYTCSFPDCEKAFTTSGHLARHNRIHTGEKNFKCPHPNCNSRFSRQDNMMQHYRTHISSKSRRPIKSQRGYGYSNDARQVNSHLHPYTNPHSHPSAHPYYMPSVSTSTSSISTSTSSISTSTSAPAQPQSTYISMPTYSSYPQYAYTYQTYSQPLPPISPILQRLNSPPSLHSYTHQKRQSADGLDTLANAALV